MLGRDPSGNEHDYMPGTVGRPQSAPGPSRPPCLILSHSCAASLEQLMLWVFPSKGDCLLIIEFTLLFSRASRVSFKVFRMHFPRLVCLHHFYQSPYPNANPLELATVFHTDPTPSHD